MLMNNLLNSLNKPENLRYFITSDKFLAIDIGTSNTKVMEIKRSGLDFKIERVLTLHHMKKFFNGQIINNRKALVDSIIYSLRKEGIKTKKVHLVFSSGNSKTKLVKVPNVNPKEFNSYLEVEYQKEFPNTGRAQNAFSYARAGEVKGTDHDFEQMLVLATASQSELTDIIKEFKKNKYHVEIVDATLNILRHLGEIGIDNGNNEKDYKNIAILDLGNQNTKVIFTKKNVPIFNREIDYGVIKAIRSIQSETGTTSEEAERMLEAHGFHAKKTIQRPLADDISADSYNKAIKESFVNGLNELYRSVEFVNSNMGVKTEELLITGGMGNVKRILPLAVDTFDIPVRIWSFGDGENMSFQNGLTISNHTGIVIDASYAQCFGIVLGRLFK